MSEEFRKPGMDNIIKSQSTGITTNSLPLMDKGKKVVGDKV